MVILALYLSKKTSITEYKQERDRYHSFLLCYATDMDMRLPALYMLSRWDRKIFLVFNVFPATVKLSSSSSNNVYLLGLSKDFVSPYTCIQCRLRPLRTIFHFWYFGYFPEKTENIFIWLKWSKFKLKWKLGDKPDVVVFQVTFKTFNKSFAFKLKFKAIEFEYRYTTVSGYKFEYSICLSSGEILRIELD